MKISAALPFAFLAFTFVSLFALTTLGSAIPKPAPADFDSLRTLFDTLDRAPATSTFHTDKQNIESRNLPFNSHKDPRYVCGTFFSPRCPERNSASGHRVPRLFKLPAMLIEGLRLTGKSVASAVPSRESKVKIRSRTPGDIASSQELEARQPIDAVSEKRQTLFCGYSLIDIDCGSPGAATSLRVPSIFSMPTLFIKLLALISKSVISALPSFNVNTKAEFDSRSLELVSLTKRSSFSCGANNFQECNAGNILEASRIFSPLLLTLKVFSSDKASWILSFPKIVFNSIGSLPGASASAIPPERKQRASLEDLSPSVELRRLSRSLSLPSFKSQEARNEDLLERAYLPYCHCNENGCTRESPPCCANGSCWTPATLQSGAPSQCALGGAWIAVLSLGVGFARFIIL